MSAERERIDGFGRLEDGLLQASGWYLWGPYVSERQWGTVREDYSADGEAWAYLPHDHARSRAYRWGEDGLAGFCDIHQRLCLAEYELLDTGVFDHDRYWIAEVCYAKADPTDLLMTVQVTNAGPDADTVHVLPAAWFRNTWSWDADAPKPVLEGGRGPAVTVAHPFLGSLELIAGTGPGGTSPVTLFCENETSVARLFGAPPATPYPKDGIGDHVISGCGHRQPRSAGNQVRLLVPADPPAGCHGRVAAAAAPERQRAHGGQRARYRLRPGHQRPACRGGRVLRRADPGGCHRRGGDGDAAGLCRDAVEQAVLQL